MVNQHSRLAASRLSVYFFIFALSGGAGLIYESIWTHYLKLFLGHAAYAQTLVLAIFMGGMAIGSALAARLGHKINNALAAYAIVEAGIGIAAIIFHPIYVGSVNFAYDSVFPLLQPASILLLKWSLAALLILPQSVLLGATFPFMSAGILRRFPEMPGRSLAFLYFNNSLGAAIGVLLSGYLFIPGLGLPGTIQLAGVINLLLAATVWYLSRSDGRTQAQSQLFSQSIIPAGRYRYLFLMIVVAAITGAASFMYEIGWIRMLSMVLGSTTHAFELMLSAFILGLAIGGFIVRRFIDRLQSPLKTLAYIQLAMGALAATTLIIYGSAFEIMGYTVNNLNKTSANYWLFNLICHGIALLVMLPATICAGMTLPLITFQLLSQGHGESSIGNVYAGNTLGAILGIVLAIQWIMPSFGLKQLILSGAGLDIGLGLGILIALVLSKRFILRPFIWKQCILPALPALLAFAGIALFVQLDPLAMASGIYTTGEIRREREMIFLKDGKTASISFFRNDDYLAVATNGKTEAAISDQELAKDEPTMILLGLLPLALKSDTTTVATIGIGSGLTTHSALLSPQLTRVDTIEIEPAMVEAAQLFGDRVELTFTDPRSQIFIEDAKAYFTNQSKRYDIIISEPSNPWISGVAGLFSEEFYRHVGRYLHDDGLLVQWIHLYHIDLPQIASVVKALSPHFSDYRIYALNLSDIAIVASKQGQVSPLSDQLFQHQAVAAQLQRLGITGLHDLAIRDLGSKIRLQQFFNSYPAPANSDFAPYLDYSASRSRFLQASATDLLALNSVPKAMLEFIGMEGRQLPAREIGPNHHLPIAASAHTALNLLAALPPELLAPCASREQAMAWIQRVHSFADVTLTYFSRGEIDGHWQALENSSCLNYLSETSLHWIRLYRALANNNAEATIASATALYPENNPENIAPKNLGQQFLVAALIAAHAELGDNDLVTALLNNLDYKSSQTVVLRFIASTVLKHSPE